MTLLAVRGRGAKTIICSDISDYRRKFAERLGADYTNNPRENDLVQLVKHVTANEGVDVLLEMSGAATAIQQGFSLVRYAGDVVVFGLPTRPIEFDIANSVIFKGITVHGIVGRKMWSTWEHSDDLLLEQGRRSHAHRHAPVQTGRVRSSVCDDGKRRERQSDDVGRNSYQSSVVSYQWQVE